MISPRWTVEFDGKKFRSPGACGRYLRKKGERCGQDQDRMTQAFEQSNRTMREWKDYTDRWNDLEAQIDEANTWLQILRQPKKFQCPE